MSHYHDIIQTKASWPSYYHDILTCNLENLETIQLDTLQNWIRTYQACVAASTIMDDVPPPTHDEWIKQFSQQKKGRQTYFQPDGSFQNLPT